MRAIQREAKAAATWLKRDELRAKSLRGLRDPSSDQRHELAVLRQREINECVRLRREMTR